MSEAHLEFFQSMQGKTIELWSPMFDGLTAAKLEEYLAEKKKATEKHTKPTS